MKAEWLWEQETWIIFTFQAKHHQAKSEHSAGSCDITIKTGISRPLPGLPVLKLASESSQGHILAVPATCEQQDHPEEVFLYPVPEDHTHGFFPW